MATPVHATSTWRFGLFEVDARNAELRRAGVPIKLREQSFRILVLLLERAGELVTREDLRKALWPADTFVDFDHSLNAAVMKLREALGDTADKPLYIETIPRHGYRFIAPLAPLLPASNESHTARESSPSGPILAAAVPKHDMEERSAARWPSDRQQARIKSVPRRWIIAASLALLIACSAAVWYLGSPPQLPRITYTKLTQDGHDKILAGTDGNRIYFTDGSRFSIHQVAIRGGDPSPVPSTLHLGLVQAWDLSRDGSSLLIGQRELGLLPWEMWIVSTVGGSERHIGAATHGAFSPDGQSVVYSTYQNELWTVRTDGSGARKLAGTPGFARNLAWRPDGRVIRFTTRMRYWELQADGSNLHPILDGWKPSYEQCCGRWTPNGNFFIFLAGEAMIRGVARPSGAQIWMLDERRRLLRKPAPGPIQLTTGPVGWDSPISSADGNTIFAEGRARLGELVRVDLYTREVRPFLKGVSAEFLTFSPDGKSIAYVTFPDGIAWKAGVDGSHPVQLSTTGDYAINPEWSPDGSEIVFIGAFGNSYRSHIVSADGRNARLLLPDVDSSDPNWSPDGTRIVLAIGRTDRGRRYIGIMQIATNVITEIPDSSGLGSPRWSPDGRYIAALSPVPPCLRVFDMTTRKWRSIPIEGDINFPSWSHDGRYIYGLAFDTVRGDRSLFRAPIAGGKPELIMDLNDWKLTGWCGFSLTLDPTDAPLLLRETGSSEIYALKLDRR